MKAQTHLVQVGWVVCYQHICCLLSGLHILRHLRQHSAVSWLWYVQVGMKKKVAVRFCTAAWRREMFHIPLGTVVPLSSMWSKAKLSLTLIEALSVACFIAVIQWLHNSSMALLLLLVSLDERTITCCGCWWTVGADSSSLPMIAIGWESKHLRSLVKASWGSKADNNVNNKVKVCTHAPWE